MRIGRCHYRLCRGKRKNTSNVYTAQNRNILFVDEFGIYERYRRNGFGTELISLGMTTKQTFLELPVNK